VEEKMSEERKEKAVEGLSEREESARADSTAVLGNDVNLVGNDNGTRGDTEEREAGVNPDLLEEVSKSVEVRVAVGMRIAPSNAWTPVAWESGESHTVSNYCGYASSPGTPISRKSMDTYDELNRITLKTYSDGTPQVSYSYDIQPGDSTDTHCSSKIH
jgi:hypothetical protein